MAPASAAGRYQTGRKQSTLRTFGRVTKSAAASSGTKGQSKEVTPSVRVSHGSNSNVTAGTKRRRDEVDDDQEDSTDRPVTELIAKKARIQHYNFETSSQSSIDNDNESPTSSQSSRTSFSSALSATSLNVPTKPITLADLPLTLKNILSLHESFLKALSIHYAHNGPSTPAELSSLTKTITCLWKKHTVDTEDIRRMLALYEFSPDNLPVFLSRFEVKHKLSPFKLTSSLGVAKSRISVEYGPPSSGGVHSDGSTCCPFNEKNLQCLFRADLLVLYKTSLNTRKTYLAFLDRPIADFPLLTCELGKQSAIRQKTASVRRAEILDLSARAQSRQQNLKSARSGVDNLADKEEKTEVEVALAVKSRTQSLFDRIKTKQALNASSTAPTAADILRHHAIGHVGQVVEILRMKQQQKNRSRLAFAGARSEIGLFGATGGGKVSFSMQQLQTEIQDSLSVPIGSEEIKVALELLAEERNKIGNWLRIVENGTGERKRKFVVLEGEGMAGREIQRRLEEKRKGE